MVQVKGYEIPLNVKDSTYRRALQYQTKIFKTLSALGLTEDDIEIPLERLVIKKAKASCGWYYDGHYLYFSYDKGTFIQNLHVVAAIIEKEINALVTEQKTIHEFIEIFSEDKDIEEQRKEARKTLGVDENCKDTKEIDAKYKELARKYHPDMPTGDIDLFKKVNNAHKLLKRELW